MPLFRAIGWADRVRCDRIQRQRQSAKHKRLRTESDTWPMRILIAEDDSILADGLSRSLRQNGYAVDAVNDGL